MEDHDCRHYECRDVDDECRWLEQDGRVDFDVAGVARRGEAIRPEHGARNECRRLADGVEAPKAERHGCSGRRRVRGALLYMYVCLDWSGSKDISTLESRQDLTR